MTDNDKKNWYIGIGVVVLLIIIYAVYASTHKNSPSSTTMTQGQTASPAPAPATSTPSTTGTKKLAYGDAIKTYKERFQFSMCHGTPGIISVKKGTPVMLDNRDKVAHTIKANGQTFRIAALDYALIYPQLPTGDSVNLANSNVTCDGGGAATLNVEK
jgi:hypothetical protein